MQNIIQSINNIVVELINIAPEFVESKTSKNFKNPKIERRFLLLFDDMRMLVARLNKDVVNEFIPMFRTLELLATTRSQHVLKSTLRDLLS